MFLCSMLSSLRRIFYEKKPIIKQRKSLDLVNELEIDGNVISKEKKKNESIQCS